MGLGEKSSRAGTDGRQPRLVYCTISQKKSSLLITFELRRSEGEGEAWCQSITDCCGYAAYEARTMVECAQSRVFEAGQDFVFGRFS
jgi:hypothetical protein